MTFFKKFDTMFMVIKMNFLEKYGIYLKDKTNLETALTHSSYSNEHGSPSYERLEFLGDAVLELIISEYLYDNFDYPEGKMSKLRSEYVCEHALYEYAKEIGYIDYIRVGNGQIHNVNETIIADIFEAILASVYLECGFDVAKKYVVDIIKPYIDNKVELYKDYKSLLQEMVQTDKRSLEYKLISETGPSHDKTYIVEVLIDNMVYGKGAGKSKKEAEKNAAYDAYKKNANIKDV